MCKTELSEKNPSCLKSFFPFHEALSSFKYPKRSTNGGGGGGGGGRGELKAKIIAPWVSGLSVE